MYELCRLGRIFIMSVRYYSHRTSHWHGVSEVGVCQGDFLSLQAAITVGHKIAGLVSLWDNQRAFAIRYRESQLVQKIKRIPVVSLVTVMLPKQSPHHFILRVILFTRSMRTWSSSKDVLAQNVSRLIFTKLKAVWRGLRFELQLQKQTM